MGQPGKTNRRIGPTRAIREVLQQGGGNEWHPVDEIIEGLEIRFITGKQRKRALERMLHNGEIEHKTGFFRLKSSVGPQKWLGGPKPRTRKNSRTLVR